MELHQLFVDFLKVNKCFKRFCVNYKRNCKLYQVRANLKENIYRRRSDIITCSFYFQNTPEGHSYWEDLNRKWKLIYDIFYA